MQVYKWWWWLLVCQEKEKKMVTVGPVRERKKKMVNWEKQTRQRTEVQGRVEVGGVKGKNCWKRTYEIFLPNILVIKNKVEDSLGILYKKKERCIHNFGVQITCNEKVSNHLQFLNAILRDFKNTILLKSWGQTPEDLRFRSKLHF